MERQCRMGGFCFYRLEEPNGLDTYSALSVLNLLEAPFTDEKTVSYLQNMQHDDGSYDSVFSAFYSLKSLQHLHGKPRYDPWPYIMQHIRSDHVDADILPAEITSVFRRMVFLVDLYNTFKENADEVIEDHFTAVILNFYNDDKGFGPHQSTLSETAKALVMLAQLHFPVQSLQTEEFVRECETPMVGFTDMPRVSLYYLEYVHAGVQASSVMGRPPRYLDQCIAFIKNCQTRTGGFSRVTHGGIATLEDTFYAISALKILSAW